MSPCSAAPPPSEPSAARIALRDGTRLHALLWEPAPHAATSAAAPVLLVHGLASNALLWTGVGAALAAAGHRVVAVDQRAHGRSDPSDDLGWATLTEDLVEVCAALGLHRPLAVGQSWGGNVVVELAHRRPQAVRGIACLDGGWIELSRRFPDWAACWAALAPPRLEGVQLADLAAGAARRQAGWPPAAVPAQLGNLAVRADGTAAAILTPERHEAIVRGLWNHRPSTRWAGLALPVLLLPVTGPAGLPSSEAVALAERLLPRVRIHAFADRHHDVHAQAPDEVAAVLLAALRDGFLDPTAAGATP